MIRRLIILLLIVGCEEDADSKNIMDYDKDDYMKDNYITCERLYWIPWDYISGDLSSIMCLYQRGKQSCSEMYNWDDITERACDTIKYYQDDYIILCPDLNSGNKFITTYFADTDIVKSVSCDQYPTE